MTHKPRIVVLGQVPPLKGGIAHYNALFINELMEHADVLTISFKRVFPRWLHPLKTNKDTESKNIFRGSAEFIFDIPDIRSWGKVVKRIRDYRPDAFIFHWYTPVLAVPYWYLLRRIRKALPLLRIIALCHNIVPHERTPFDRMLTRAVLRRVNFGVVHSKGDEEAFRRWVPGVNVKRLFLPVFDFFPRGILREDARKKLGVEGNVALFFGGIREYKGLSYLLEGMACAIKAVPITLLIAGEFFGNRKKYDERIAALGIGSSIRIHDSYIPNEEVAVFFEAADVVVAPYTSGTQSGAINIAIAFEKPLIATNVGGFAEIVVPGKTGYLVPPKKSDAIADALVTFFTTPHPSFTEGMKKIKKEHSWNALVDQILPFLSRPE